MIIKNSNTLGILAIMASTASYVVNDMFIKMASANLPQGEIITIRSVIAFLLIGMIAWYRHGVKSLNVIRYGTVKIRLFSELAATIFYLAALFNMPFANAIAILQMIPLLVIIGCALFFHEKIGRRRWFAITIGLSGALLIIRPGLEGFDGWSLAALAAAFFMASRDLATRKIPLNVPTFSVAWLTTIAVGLMGICMSPFEDWQPVDLITLSCLAAAAIFILLAYVSTIVAIKLADLAVIAPFHYSTIIWAIIIGYLVWNEIPDIPTISGIAILVGTGTYTFIRERNLRKQGNGKPISN